MVATVLTRLMEHNNWANLQILEACESLTDKQLDRPPETAVYGTIRETLQHILLSQEDYATMLTTFDHPPERESVLTFSELRKISIQSGQELISRVQDISNHSLPAQIDVSDGYKVDAWVFILQVINHATEHREQIKSMISALGIEPPRVDGWAYGRLQDALIPPQP